MLSLMTSTSTKGHESTRRKDVPTQHAAFLANLRGSGVERPTVDPELAGGLRDWIEDSVSEVVAALPPTAAQIRLGPETRSDASGNLPTDRLVLERLAGIVFRQWVTTNCIGDPLEDALAAAEASPDTRGLSEVVARMSSLRRRRLSNELSRHASAIKRSWPALQSSWQPRTCERLTVPLCGGKVVLGAVADLVIGPAATDRASVCIVDAKAEPRRDRHRAQAHFLALLETLRAGAPPSRTGTFYTQKGDLSVEPVDEHLLVAALLATIDALERLCTAQAAPSAARGLL